MLRTSYVMSLKVVESSGCIITDDSSVCLRFANASYHSKMNFQVFLGLSLLLLGTGSGQFHSNRFNPQLQNQQQPQHSIGGSAGHCPELNGRFAVGGQCDAYIECVDGVAKSELCPDGLMFNPEARFGYPCGYPVNVNCEGRASVQPPQPTEGCPHSYGYFRSADPADCGRFTNCVGGRAFNIDCPLGLAFNEQTLQCDWPDQVPSCDAEAFLGFTCPAPSGSFPANYELFRSQADCTKYFVCLNGRPRLMACPEGTGFSDEVGDCIENPPGCNVPRPEKPLRESQTPFQRHQHQFQNSNQFGKK